MVRLVAWLSLFVDYLRSKKAIQVSGYVTAAQLKRAELVLLKRVKVKGFSKEISALENGKELPCGSRLKDISFHTRWSITSWRTYTKCKCKQMSETSNCPSYSS